MINRLGRHFSKHPIKYIIGLIILVGLMIFIGKIGHETNRIYGDSYQEDKFEPMRYIVVVVHMNSRARVEYPHECESTEIKNGIYFMYDREGEVIHSEKNDRAQDVILR